MKAHTLRTSSVRRRTRTATSASDTRTRRAGTDAADLSASPVAAIDIDANRRLLNRYRFVQHEMMRILAGWLPKAATFELKCELGRTLWENSLHVNALYLRLREIQSPAFQKPADAALVSRCKSGIDVARTAA